MLQSTPSYTFFYCPARTHTTGQGPTSMIILKNVTLRRGSKVLLDSTSVTLNPGEKTGLVGRNGAGKSSLFAVLNGTLHEDGGEFSIPAQWRMSQVAQDMPETEQSATDFVVDGDTLLLAAQAEVDTALAGDDGMQMAHAYMALHDAGAHDARDFARDDRDQHEAKQPVDAEQADDDIVGRRQRRQARQNEEGGERRQ